ncbi:MAG: hypothetical protein ACKV2V_30635 [Blastocatellia bacterium]
MKKTLIAGLLLFLAVSPLAQDKSRKSAAPKPKAEENWRVRGGPQRDFLTPGAGIFRAGSENWMATPPKKLWERRLGDVYSTIAVEAGAPWIIVSA